MSHTGFRPIIVLLILYLFATLLTIVASNLAGSPYVPIFKHTFAMLLLVLLYIGVMGIIWDGALIILGKCLEAWQKWIQPTCKYCHLTVSVTKNIRFYTLGPSPLILLLITTFIIYGTGNITLISLSLVGSTIEWRDPLFWAIEGPIIKWLIHFPINTAAWDTLYHSAWGIELFAFFVLVLIGRNSKIVLSYCISMIILFYTGRFLGVINPVMGPAFFKPELYTYLDGSVTELAMQKVADIMASSPDLAKEQSGILLGGVSAMPSLHMGMVSLTAFWLAIVQRKTLFVTIPWILMVWTSTVVLGWHYLLDGVGGIALAAACVWLTQRILLTYQVRSSSPSLSNTATT